MTELACLEERCDSLEVLLKDDQVFLSIAERALRSNLELDILETSSVDVNVDGDAVFEEEVVDPTRLEIIEARVAVSEERLAELGDVNASIVDGYAELWKRSVAKDMTREELKNGEKAVKEKADELAVVEQKYTTWLKDFSDKLGELLTKHGIGK